MIEYLTVSVIVTDCQGRSVIYCYLTDYSKIGIYQNSKHLLFHTISEGQETRSALVGSSSPWCYSQDIGQGCSLRFDWGWRICLEAHSHGSCQETSVPCQETLAMGLLVSKHGFLQSQWSKSERACL